MEVSDSEPDLEDEDSALSDDEDMDSPSLKGGKEPGKSSSSKKIKRSRKAKRMDRIPLIVESDYEDSRDSFVSSSFVGSPTSTVTSLSQVPSPSSLADKQ